MNIMWKHFWRNETARFVMVLVLLMVLLTLVFVRLMALQGETQQRELASVALQERSLLTGARQVFGQRVDALCKRAKDALKQGQAHPNLRAWLVRDSGRIHIAGDVPSFSYPTGGQASAEASRWVAMLEDDRLFPSGRSHRMTATVELGRLGAPLTPDQERLWQGNMMRLWRQERADTLPGFASMLKRLPESLAGHFEIHRKLLRKARGLEVPGLWVEASGRIGAVIFSERQWQDVSARLAEMGVSLASDPFAPEPVFEAHVNRATILKRHQRERLVLYGLAGLLAATFLVLGLSIKALLASQRRKQMMVHTVSHEFRTPLASMLQFAELLLDKRYASPQKADAYLRMLYHQGLRLKALVENVMTLAKIEKNLVRINPSPMGTHIFLQELHRFYVLMDDYFAEHLEMQIDHEPMDIMLDSEALNRVLTNLTDNARKYGKPPILFHATVQGDAWVLTVRDQGPGMSPEMRARVFKPYTRGHNTSKEGLGLGLSVVKALVTAMGGSIEARSNGGFNMVIKLPIVNAEAGHACNALPH